MVWRFHGEADASGGAFGGNLPSSTAVDANHGGEQCSSSSSGHSVAGNNADFITMDDLVQGMANGEGDEDGEPPTMLVLEDAELYEELTKHLGNNDVLFRIRSIRTV
jgi:hypothetical protein